MAVVQFKNERNKPLILHTHAEGQCNRTLMQFWGLFALWSFDSAQDHGILKLWQNSKTKINKKSGVPENVFHSLSYSIKRQIEEILDLLQES